MAQEIKPNSYATTIEVAQAPEAVFSHINNVDKWFSNKGFVGSSEKLNDEFVFRYGEGNHAHYSKQKLVEVIPNKKVVWLVTDSKIDWIKNNKQEWTNTKMVFDIEAHGGKTVVHFTHEGMMPELECYAECEKGWDMIIKEWLLNYITNGKTTKKQDYTAAITVGKTPEEVFNSVAAITKWWSKDFEGSSTKLNDEFVICHPGAHYSKQKLVEVIPNRKVVWLVTESNLDWLEKDTHEWTNTKMIFDITKTENKTVLHFTHEGLVPEKECYARCSQGWNMVIKQWLFNFIADGKTI